MESEIYAHALARLDDEFTPLNKAELELNALLRALLVERQAHMGGIPEFLRTDKDSAVDVALRAFAGESKCPSGT